VAKVCAFCICGVFYQQLPGHHAIEGYRRIDWRASCPWQKGDVCVL